MGFIISHSVQPVFSENFTEISSRILKFEMEKITLFSAYCPIDQKKASEASSKNTSFFSKLNKALEGAKKSNVIVLLGDFNCTLRKRHRFAPYVGQFALRNNFAGDYHAKTNADLVVETACRNKLWLINTLQKKKLCDFNLQTTPNNDKQ